MKRVLVVYAVKEEFVSLKLSDCKIKYIITGIGKANAAMKLTKEILSNNFDFVLNIGTAGTIKNQIGDIFVCDKFIDRDLTPLSEYGVNAHLNATFDEYFNISTLLQEWSIKRQNLAICNTGDTFVSDLKQEIEGDVIDMEAFALAMVCKEFNVPFLSVKYITDIVGRNSIENWESKLSDARAAIDRWFHGR